MNSQLNCGTHGTQLRTRVCQHLVESLDTKVAVGFHWSAEDTGPYPDAWCSDCDAAMPFGDAEWTEDLSSQVGISDLCSSCYEQAKDIWRHARGESL
jgi:bacterioferritin-associated ferredoxin